MKAAFIKSLVELVQNQQKANGSCSITSFNNFHKRRQEPSLLSQEVSACLMYQTNKKARSEQHPVNTKAEHSQSKHADNESEHNKSLMIVAETLLSFAGEQLDHLTRIKNAQVTVFLAENCDVGQVGVSFRISKNTFQFLPPIYISMLIRLGIESPDFGNRLVFISIESLVLNLMFTKSRVNILKKKNSLYKEQGYGKERDHIDEFVINKNLKLIKSFSSDLSMSIKDPEFQKFCQIPRFLQVDSKFCIIFPVDLFTEQDVVRMFKFIYC
jgi:hypothetical protein